MHLNRKMWMKNVKAVQLMVHFDTLLFLIYIFNLIIDLRESRIHNLLWNLSEPFTNVLIVSVTPTQLFKRGRDSGLCTE